MNAPTAASARTGRPADEQLRISRKEIGDLRAALDEHAIVAITDPQGRITFVNEKFCVISKYAREELLGQDHRIINSGYHSKEFFRELWRTIARGNVWHGEIRNRAKDGTFYWVDTTIVPFLDDAGKPRQYVAIRADITQRVRAEEARARLAAIVASSDDAIMAKTLDGTITNWNAGAERIFGYTAEEIVGKPVLELFPPDRRDEEREILERIGRGQMVDHFETERVRKDGRRVFVSVSVSPVRDESGRIVGAAKIARDITAARESREEIRRLNADLERRVAERTKELEAANRELEAFSYSVSHDLRAPLRAMDGFSQAALEDFGPQLPEEGRHYLNRIRESAQRMGALIDDLLKLSRLSRTPVAQDLVDTEELVRLTLEELGAPWPERSVEMRVGLLPACRGDAALLKHVWSNLIANALKYTRRRRQATIEIGAVRSEGVDVFHVRDNGAGFDMRYAQKLFGVFQRLHRAEDYEGTGVGLAIVQRIVHRHRGRIWAEAAVDEGATFHFTLGDAP
ncbi:MAG TPA: PAS domain S-box protein [Opitutus sp.]|nr:PAS domain S-box protein [Opitutus sp.]